MLEREHYASGGYRLTPAIDLVPNVTGRGEHTLQFRYSSHRPGRADFMKLATLWDVPGAAQIVDQVIDAVTGFAPLAAELQVQCGGKLDSLIADVTRRVGRLRV